ncbi:MAG: hypothetical protein ACRDTG_30610 [Pseudonocardiaceae bacterium]
MFTMAPFKIRWDVPIHINGEIINMTAEGWGDPNQGTLSVDTQFNQMPEGFDAAAILMWTSSDSTLVGRVHDGAVNLGMLTHGNYDVIRTIDFRAGYGHMQCAWHKRYSTEDNTVYTTGVVTGHTSIPRIKSATAMVEKLAQPYDGCIVGQFATTLVPEADAPSIEPLVHATYTFEPTFGRMPFEQVRTAGVTLERVSDVHLKLDYQVEFRPAF